LITKPLESSNLLTTVQGLLATGKHAKAAAEARTDESVGSAPTTKLSTPETAPVQPESSWEDDTQEEFSTTTIQRMEIPEEVSQQPVGMFTDLLGSSDRAQDFPVGQEDSVTDQPTAVEPREEAAKFETPAATPETARVWTAEPAAVTEEEERLFDQPAGNWGDLTQLVEEERQEEQATEAAGTKAPDSYEIISAPADRGPEIDTELPAPGIVEGPSEMEFPAPWEEEQAGPSVAGEPVAKVGEPHAQTSVAPAAMDSAAVEQLVREAVERILPEIVEHVKQSLKS
jgi:hypothetical protein